MVPRDKRFQLNHLRAVAVIDLVQADRQVLALDFDRIHFSDVKEAWIIQLAIGRVRDEHPQSVHLRGAFQTGSQVDGIAKHRRFHALPGAYRAHGDGPVVDADPDLDRHLERIIDCLERGIELDDRLQGIIDRMGKESHDGIADNPDCPFRVDGD
jgi:hypothetical protein